MWNFTLALYRFVHVGQILFRDVLGIAQSLDGTLFKKHSAVAQAVYCGHIMAHKKYGVVLHETTQKAHALLCEKGISHRQCLVHNKNIRIHVRHDSKGQTHHHPAGVTFYRLIDEFANVGKGDDVIVSGVDFLVGQAQNGGIEIHIFPSGEFRVEPATEFEQRGHASLDVHLTGRRCQRTGDNL